MGRAHAETSATTEKEAFEAAKELGTAEAWDAFLANYSTGFHADLARAYLKKLADQPQAVEPPPTAYPPPDFQSSRAPGVASSATVPGRTTARSTVWRKAIPSR